MDSGSARAVVTVPGAPGVQILSAAEVLQNHTVIAPDGSLLFTDATGVAWKLVTDIEDPEITNPRADGFYEADLDAVVATLGALPDEFLWTVDCVVYLLPYPRSGQLGSSAAEGAVYLSPGVQPREDGPVLRSTVAHEFGHAVHFDLLPDGDPRWDAYRELRGIEDEAVFHAGASHAYRPHEIFAEDFRVLFGDPLAAGDGTVENPLLDSPLGDLALSSFFESLPALGPTARVTAASEPGAVWRIAPNPLPAGGTLQLRSADGEATLGGLSGPSSRAVLLDAAGRRVDELRLTHEGAGRWSASLGEIRRLRAGAYWLVLRDAKGATRSVALRVTR